MASTVRLKRSAVQGKAPVVGDLELGELAVNTYDGKLYMKKNDGGDSIVEITAAGGYTDPLTTNGDILIRSGGATTRLGIGSEGQALLVSSGLPVWGNVAGGYTDPLTTDGDIVIRSGGSTVRLGIGSEGQVLKVSSGLPVWAAESGGYTDPLTTDGDIVIRSGGSTTRLGIGSEGQVLKVSSGLPVWAADAGGLADVVDDTTPQLGGNLDVNGNYIISASGGDVEIAPDTTGSFVIRGNNTDGSITLNCTANTHGVTIQSPPHASAATYTLILPDDTGTSGQVLSTNGTGTLSWLTATQPGDNISTLTNDSGYITTGSTTSDAAPSTPSDGDLWYRSSDGRMYVYYDDGNTQQWVDANPNLPPDPDTFDRSGTTVSLVNSGDTVSLDGDLTVDTDTLHVDSANNRVGVGTSSPEEKLHITGNNSAIGSDWTNAVNLIRIEDADTTQANGQITGGIIFEGNDSDAPGVQAGIFAQAGSGTGGGDIAFHTAASGTTLDGTESPRMVIDADGNVGIGTTPAVKLDVAGEVRASTGVLFGTDTAAANTLDDYEEGTWTPGIEGGTTAGSYTFTANDTYTKVGNKVTAWCDLSNITTVSAGSGSTVITGLPFVSALGFPAVGSIMLDQWDFSTSQRYAVARVQNGTDEVTPRMIRDNLSDNGLDITTKTNDDADISFCVTYTVA